MIRFVCILLLMAAPAAAYGFYAGGELSTAYELSKESDQGTKGLWENSLRLDNAELFTPYLGLNFYGKYSLDDDDDFTDIYSAYLYYSSFQQSVELKLGRFDYVGNSFLTLDGAELTMRTDYYFGATVFAGSPEYFDTDDRHINETFRDTGERLYGGKIFLNGVKKTTGYISFSKEELNEDTVQELAGMGLGRSFSLGAVQFNTGGKLTYDTKQNDIYKGDLRLYTQYKKLTVIAGGTRYNVQDGSSYENELVISNFLSGKEDRLSYTVQYAFTDNITGYQSTIYSNMEVVEGKVVEGEIYKLGMELDYFKSIGLSGNIEGYYYTNKVSDASGGSVAAQWHITRKLRLNFETELLTMENTDVEETVYLTYLSAQYDIQKDLTVSIFGENNNETAYLPENRYGAKVAYRF